MKEFIRKIENGIRDIPYMPRALLIGIFAIVVLLMLIPFIKKSYGKEKIALKVSQIVIIAICIGLIVLLAVVR